MWVLQVPTGNFEGKPKPVPTSVHVIEVNTGSFFTTIERWRDLEELLGWVRRQAARAGFTISIDKSSTISPYMTMHCERSCNTSFNLNILNKKMINKVSSFFFLEIFGMTEL